MATATGYPLSYEVVSVVTERRRSRGMTAYRVVGVGCVIASALVLSVDRSEPERASAVSMLSARPPQAMTDALESRIALLEVGLVNARSTFTASHGRVLDDSARSELAHLIEGAESTNRSAQLLIALAAPGAIPERADPLVSSQEEAIDKLALSVAAVEAEIVTWEAEQARIEAAKEAARLAAEVAARTQARVRPASVAAVAGPHIENIWGSGGQAEIDACRGSVNLRDIAAYLGGAFYAAEHWSCGGRAWAGVGAGEFVDFPGFGTFQVASVVGGLPAGAHASSLPSGYDGYFQTCMGGDTNNLHVWLLTRAG